MQTATEHPVRRSAFVLKSFLRAFLGSDSPMALVWPSPWAVDATGAEVTSARRAQAVAAQPQ
jgi:hypothetical protein